MLVALQGGTTGNWWFLPTGPIYVIPASWQSLWAALEQLMTRVGSLSTRSIADRFGRRFVFFLAGIFLTAGVAILYTWNTAPGYLVERSSMLCLLYLYCCQQWELALKYPRVWKYVARGSGCLV